MSPIVLYDFISLMLCPWIEGIWRRGTTNSDRRWSFWWIKGFWRRGTTNSNRWWNFAPVSGHRWGHINTKFGKLSFLVSCINYNNTLTTNITSSLTKLCPHWDDNFLYEYSFLRAFTLFIVRFGRRHINMLTKFDKLIFVY